MHIFQFLAMVSIDNLSTNPFSHIRDLELLGWRGSISIVTIVQLPATLGPEVCSASNRNEYQKQKNNISGE
jgi:hypothetical protein